MRDVGIDLSRLLATSHGVRPLVSAWLGEELLAPDVPILGGSLIVDAAAQVPEKVSIIVPASHRGQSLVPTDPRDPLAQYGQRLSVAYVLPRTGAADIAVPLGWFAVQDWDADAETVQVEAMGLLQVVADARLLQPTSPGVGATLGSEFARLMPQSLPFEIDPALVDRPCPRSFVWDEDRLGALYDIADAWPARLWVDSDGVVRLSPDVPSVPADPVVWWTDGDRGGYSTLTGDYFVDIFTDLFSAEFAVWENREAGTVITAPRAGTRDEVFNAVVVRAEAMDDPNRPPVQGFAHDDDPASPTWWDGEYGQVPRFAASPLVTTAAQCTAMAEKLLRASLRPTRTRVVSAVPDPRVEADDVASLTFDGETVIGYVSGITLPLTADGGAATYTVEVP